MPGPERFLSTFRAPEVLALKSALGAALGAVASDGESSGAGGPTGSRSGGVSAHAILYGLRGCVFARATTSGFALQSEPQAPVTDVYEARVFGSGGELRWVADGSAALVDGHLVGQAVLLTEGTQAPKEWTRDESQLRPLREDHYLVWGQVSESGQQWSHLYEHRVGALWVPCSLTKGSRARIAFCEYESPPDAHGNVAVAAERLVAIKPYAVPQRAEEGK